MSSQLLVKPQEEYQDETAVPQEAACVPCISLAPPQRPLFSQSFVELNSGDRKRKRLTAASSFTVQALVVAFLVLLPLWLTDSLPTQQLATFLVAPPPPPPPPPPAAPAMKAPKVVSQVVNGQLMAPSRIPKEVKMIKEEEAPPPIQTGVVGGVVGGVPGGQVGGVIGSLLSTTANSTAPAVAAPKRLRVSSGISEGLLLKKIEPLYPIIAQRAHIQGSVQLRAIISKDGTIENLQLISGHPMLAPAAIEAVKQWRYRPYILNGEPLEVETTVFVNFHLNL
jgi:periplasmic protein TonB